MGLLRWRGIMAKAPKRSRMALMALLVILCVSCAFTQLGFVPLYHLGLQDVFALFLLIPISLGALVLGTPSSFVLGIICGAVTYLHATFMPLDYHELTIVTPFTSIVTYPVSGLVLGLFYGLLIPKARSVKKRLCVIAIACTAYSVVGSIIVYPFLQIDSNIVAAILQTVIDVALMTLPCLVVLVLQPWVEKVREDMPLRLAFRATLVVVVLLSYVVIVAIGFTLVTGDALRETNAEMQSEVNYLCIQIKNAANGQVDSVLDGYTMEQTGTVSVIVDGRLYLTDDKRLTIGENIRDLFDDGVCDAIDESIRTGGLQTIIYDGVLTSPGDTGGHGHEKQIGYLFARQQGDYTVVSIQPSSQAFKDRGQELVRQTTVVFIILTVMTIIISRMLDSMVTRRIEETNTVLDHITCGDLDVRVGVEGAHEFQSLAKGINKTVDALQVLIGEAERRIEKDLKTARAIQEGALPKKFPAFPHIDGVDLFASMDAAKMVGGDFYDFFEVDDHTIAFIVADVSGKGIPGALFMMAAKAEIQNYISTGMKLEEAIRAANEYLCANNEAQMFVTVWAATLDWQTGLLTFVNAGHNHPLLRKGTDGPWEWIKDQGGAILGFFDGITYRQHTLTLEPGDEILLYTDGVNEAFNPENEEYGNERLEAFLAAHLNERPEPLARALRTDVDDWANGAEQSDDITILVLEYRQ